jgi:predicted O-methyltransferase YrrM
MTMSKPLSPSEPAIAVAPLNDIPFARINLGAIENPTPLIARSPEFAETKRYFRDAPSAARSLLNESSQALLYTVIRNLQPDHVVEIGTYKGGTSETLCRALHANGHGTLHTLSPFDAELFAANSQWWPEELQRVVQYYPMTSMEFFIVSDTMKLAFDLVLVDGNHDYEFANFDIQSAARRLTPGGFIFIDNVSQAGPFLAATEFLAAHPDWIDCGVRPLNTAREHAFDRSRSNVPLTDFFVFRASRYYTVGAKPQNFGEIGWTNAPVRGLRLSLAGRQAAGTLRVQCILRAFGDARIDELIGEAVRTIDGDSPEIAIEFTDPIAADGEFRFYRVETWLIWIGPRPLRLAKAPSPF